MYYEELLDLTLEYVQHDNFPVEEVLVQESGEEAFAAFQHHYDEFKTLNKQFQKEAVNSNINGAKSILSKMQKELQAMRASVVNMKEAKSMNSVVRMLNTLAANANELLSWLGRMSSALIVTGAAAGLSAAVVKKILKGSPIGKTIATSYELGGKTMVDDGVRLLNIGKVAALGTATLAGAAAGAKALQSVVNNKAKALSLIEKVKKKIDIATEQLNWCRSIDKIVADTDKK